jgi:lysyl-tRNA synthetase class I
VISGIPGFVTTPVVVATGFTAAFLGDERTLREFIVGDEIRENLAKRGDNAILYLVNDSYDPLNERQLRLGVNKDETLIRRFQPFCGRPISEIPDPFDCHPSYAAHYLEGLLQRLHALDIHPTVMDAYRAYRGGHYAEYIAITFRDYSRIREALTARFPHSPPRDLFRAQCPRCLCLDSTSIREVKGKDVRLDCERCGVPWRSDVAGLKGKLSWKLDCAARWNIYQIDVEAFSKNHLADTGTVSVARCLAEGFFGVKIPAIIGYGDVKISRDLSGQLLHLLPPSILKALFLSHPTRDLHLSRDSVLAFCQKCQIRPGVSYVDWVRRELPLACLRWSGWKWVGETIPADRDEVLERTLVHHGDCFSRFYYQRSHGVGAPDPKVLETADVVSMVRAAEMLSYAMSVRKGNPMERRIVGPLIRSHLHSQVASPEFYRFLRRLLGQKEGPNLGTLLSSLPLEYLDTVRTFCTLAAALPLRSAILPRESPSVSPQNPAKERPDEEAARADGTYGPACERELHGG